MTHGAHGFGQACRPAPSQYPFAYLALAKAAAARPGWKVPAAPERMRPECSRAMMDGKRAVGSAGPSGGQVAAGTEARAPEQGEDSDFPG